MIKFRDGSIINILSKDTLVFENSTISKTFSEENKDKFDSGSGEIVVEYEGLTINPNSNCSYAKAEVAPQGTSPSHYHEKLSETYYVYEGTAEVYLNGQIHTVCTGEYIEILPGIVHQLKNPSLNEQLSIFVVCNPAWFAADFHPCEMTKTTLKIK